MPTVDSNLTLDIAYLMALADFLRDRAESEPPADVEIVDELINVGRWQDSPEREGPVITLHVGNPRDEAGSGKKDWRHEMIEGSQEIGGESCTSALWHYRYCVQMQYYMTRSGEDQQRSLELASRTTQWLHRQLSRCPRSELYARGMPVVTVYGERHIQHMVVSIEFREGGGPGSYIQSSLLFIEQLVSHT